MKLEIQLFGGRGASSTATQRKGFGSANKDNIPVYNGKIDYTGDFTNANLSRVSDKQLREALDKQSDLYIEAVNENLGDQRTRNGRMNKLLIMMGMVVVTTAVATTASAAYVAEPDASHTAPTRRHTGIPLIGIDKMI